MRAGKGTATVITARCTTCNQIFTTDSMGTQVCPHCGTEVHLTLPEGGVEAHAPATSASRPGSGAEPSGAEVAEGRSPWETREGGALRSYIETVRLALLHPRDLFEGMTARDTRGAFSFAWISAVVGGLFSLLWSALQWKAQSAQMSALASSDPKVAAFLGKLQPAMDLLYGGLGFFLLPIVTLIGIFLMAGILHLMVMLVGANQRGFHATFRAYGYAQAPQLLAALPACGGLVAAVWSLVLTGYALMHLHRCSGAKATGAVVLVFTLSCLCCCLLYGIVVAGTLATAGLK